MGAALTTAVGPHGLLCAALVALGLLGGLAFDELPERPTSTHDGKLVLELDAHAHTRLSDGFLSPAELVMAARRRGLHAIAVTEHNTVLPAYIARGFSALRDDPHTPIVIVGEEVTTREVHLLALGIRRRVRPRRDLNLVLDAIHQQGGVAIAAHPTRRYWPALEPHTAKLDGAEVVNPMAFYRGDRAWKYSDIVSFYEHAHERGHPLAAIGASDFHFFGVLGLTRTYVAADQPTAASIVEAIRRRQTAAIGPDGRGFGNPALLAALKRTPPPPPPTHPYVSKHPLDAVTRVIALLGLLLLLTTQWRAAAQPPEPPRP